MEYSLTEIENTMMKIADRVVEIRDELTEIDSRLGDGDMGISMEKGALALQEAVKNCPETADLKMLFLQCASSVNRAAPSTMGTLLSGALMAVAKKEAGKYSLTGEELAEIPEVMAEAIAVRGKARPGDKTILDAMVPYGETLKKAYQEEGDLSSAKVLAYGAAVEGMERTKGMVAKTGRASWLGERNKEYPDGGALLFCRVAEIL